MARATRAHYTGLRDWLDAIEEIGELRRVSGANLEEEIPGITEMYQRNPGTEALLFDDIPGYPPGYRIHACIFSSPRRIALVAGAKDRDATLAGLTGAIRTRIRERGTIEPEYVSDGPVLENMDEGAAVDIGKFPVPVWHRQDGGPYIGTADLVVTRDPDADWVNVGTYRAQVHSATEIGMVSLPGKHGREHMEKHHERGEPCPVAVVCGFNPELYWASGIEVPRGESEYAYIGWWRGAPVEVIESDLTGLPIPAHAEIVLEGYIHPDKREPEGPFGEWLGYYGSGPSPQMVVDVERVLHRDDPILNGSPPSKPPCEETYYRSPLRAAYIWNQLDDIGVPGIKGVCSDPAGGSRLWTVVSVDQQYAGHAAQVGLLVGQIPENVFMNRFVIVVDDDIDPWDRAEVVWALSTRVHPPRDITVIDRTRGGDDSVQGIPWNEELPPAGSKFNARVVIDACRSWEHREDHPEVAEIDHALRDRLIGDWPELFEGFAR